MFFIQKHGKNCLKNIFYSPIKHEKICQTSTCSTGKYIFLYTKHTVNRFLAGKDLEIEEINQKTGVVYRGSSLWCRYFIIWLCMVLTWYLITIKVCSTTGLDLHYFFKKNWEKSYRNELKNLKQILEVAMCRKTRLEYHVLFAVSNSLYPV